LVKNEDGLAIAIASATTAGALSVELFNKLTNIETNAQVNVVEGAMLGQNAAKIENKNLIIPIASQENLGLVFGSSEPNQIKVTSEGKMEINSISTSKLYVPDDEELVLDAGTSFFKK
jgi:hypothetical protein